MLKMRRMPGYLIRGFQESLFFRQNINIPLPGRDEFHVISAALVNGNHVGHFLLLYQKPLLLQKRCQMRPCGLDFHSPYIGNRFLNGAVGQNYFSVGQMMFPAPFHIRGITEGCAHDGAGSLFHGNGLIRQDGNLKIIQGNSSLFAHKRLISPVIRMDKQAHASGKQFRPGGGYEQRPYLCRKVEIVKEGLAFFCLQFCLGNGCPAFRTPQYRGFLSVGFPGFGQFQKGFL